MTKDRENLNSKSFNSNINLLKRHLQHLVHLNLLREYMNILPTFSDDDSESVFREFETSASHLELPREDWTWLIKPKLTKKALTVLGGIENNTDYDLVKTTILAAYSITTEGFDQPSGS